MKIVWGYSLVEAGWKSGYGCVMPKCSLRIYRRRSPTENVGQLIKLISLSAQSAPDAEIEAQKHLSGIDWKTAFAALLADDDAKFIKFWMNEDA